MNKKNGIALLLCACTAIGLLAGCAPAKPNADVTPTPNLSTTAPTETPAPAESPAVTPSASPTPAYKLVDKFLLETKRELTQWLDTDYGPVVYSFASAAPYGNYIYLDLVTQEGVGYNLMRGLPQKDEYGLYPLPKEVMVDHEGAMLHYELEYPDRAVLNTAEGLKEMPTGTYYVEVDLPTLTITITQPDGTPLA